MDITIGLVCIGSVVALVVIAIWRARRNQQREQQRQQREDAHNKQGAEIIAATVKQHLQELSTREQQLVISEAYGLKNTKRWEKEKRKFIDQVVKPSLEGVCEGAWPLSDEDEEKLSDVLDFMITKFREDQPTLAFRGYSDECSPVEYEQFCARLLLDAGWEAHTTVATGDQGADIIATKDETTVVVQCKKYSSPVGNKAVQEAYTAMSYYNAKRAVVVSNAAYTTSAKQAAGKIGVLLLHHNDLPQLAESLTARN